MNLPIPIFRNEINALGDFKGGVKVARDFAFEPVLDEQAVPPADRVVVQQQGSGDLFTIPAGIQKHQRIGTPRQPMGRRPIPRQGDQVSAPEIKSRRKSCPITNPKTVPWQAVFRTIDESGYTCHLLPSPFLNALT